MNKTEGSLLHTPWWMWIYPRRKDWFRDGKKGLEKISFQITTIEDYLCFEKHFPSLQEGQFFMFRDSIFPEWETKENVNGGRWILSVPDKLKLRQMWFLLCEGCISENLLQGQDTLRINGIEVCYKKSYIKLWSQDCSPLSLSSSYNELLHLDWAKIKFQANAHSYNHSVIKPTKVGGV